MVEVACDCRWPTGPPFLSAVNQIMEERVHGRPLNIGILAKVGSGRKVGARIPTFAPPYFNVMAKRVDLGIANVWIPCFIIFNIKFCCNGVKFCCDGVVLRREPPFLSAATQIMEER